MPKLTDTQMILLSAASQRSDLSFYPLPKSQAEGGQRIINALTTLLSAGLAEERETCSADTTSRIDGDLSYGLFATATGLAAIGIEPARQGDQTAAPADVTLPRVTKASLLVELLQRKHGATLPELIAATGWLQHTTRAALTGLRKKGHVIERSKRDSATCYRIPAVA